MHRFLADENFPLPSVELLRAAGHDVTVVARTQPAVPDTAILDWAKSDQRTLLTFDRDFGELIFRHGHPPSPGLIFLRLPTDPPELPGRRLLDLLDDPDARIAEHFIILEEHRVRRRLLPGG